MHLVAEAQNEIFRNIFFLMKNFRTDVYGTPRYAQFSTPEINIQPG